MDLECDENKLTIMPLGAGCEVGRSCIILKYRNKTIMVINNNNTKIKCKIIFNSLIVEFIWPIQAINPFLILIELILLQLIYY